MYLEINAMYDLSPTFVAEKVDFQVLYVKEGLGHFSIFRSKDRN
jgi:hypothetical protein